MTVQELKLTLAIQRAETKIARQEAMLVDWREHYDYVKDLKASTARLCGVCGECGK